MEDASSIACSPDLDQTDRCLKITGRALLSRHYGLSTKLCGPWLGIEIAARMRVDGN